MSYKILKIKWNKKRIKCLSAKKKLYWLEQYDNIIDLYEKELRMLRESRERLIDKIKRIEYLHKQIILVKKISSNFIVYYIKK